ncbi:MAG: hypothetical protein RLZZ621_817 [Gemmatimonadota bacterium]|jgi:hypothetical protein
MVERVLARASELQAAQEAEPGETISEERLLEIAREVGLDPAHMRQAIAEQRAQTIAPLSDVSPDDGPLLRALGPSVIGAQRTVPGSPLDLLDRLDAYLPQGERLARVRRTMERTWWEPRHDPFGNLIRGLGIGGRRYDFVRSDQLVATVTRLDDARCVLRLDSTWHGARRIARTQAITLSAGLALIALWFITSVLVLGFIIPPFSFITVGLAALVAVALSAWHWRKTRIQFRQQIERARVRIEALLDEIEHERLRPPPNVVERLLGR